MTTLAEPPIEAAAEAPLAETPAVPAAVASVEAAGAAPVDVNLATAVAGLSCAAVAWLVSQLFLSAGLAFAAGLLGLVIGLGLCRASYATARPLLLQYAVLPASLIAGAVLVVPDVRGSATIWGLVGEALHAGGLLQSPVSLDPGWRLIILVLLAGLGALSLLVAVTTSRLRLAVVLPLPVVAGAALLQPKGSEGLLAIPLGLLLAALAVAGIADVRRRGGTGSAAFEMRRLARGAGLLLMLMAAVVGLTRLDFLFPDTTTSQVIPPQRPPVTPPLPDTPLFTVSATYPGPWRVGVLDAQDAEGFFLLPPQDPSKLVRLGGNGAIPETYHGPTQTIRFSVANLPGHQLPVPSDAERISGIGGELQWDPRATTLKLNDRRVGNGDAYTVVAAVPPTAKQMTAAGQPESSIAQLYEQIVPAPAAVQKLLSVAPSSGFDRLQFVRQALYSKVIASGTGDPVAMTPARVAAMLNGATASPYEITAAEVMLARWAGFPARMGFGFYGGDVLPAHGHTTSGLTTYQLWPRDGAAWLEVYFRGYGWVPVVGQPPRAQQNLDNKQKNRSQNTVQSDQIALEVYVPVREDSLLPLYEVTRYWVLVMLPVVAGGALVIVFYPGVLKLLRTRRRRRWARHGGLLPRLAVAYTELRDHCHDLNIGDSSWTPLEFLKGLDRDDEHLELASLYTRAVWGDVARDLRAEDVEAGEEMASSLRRRVAREQPFINRVLAFASRSSLRAPYSDEVPNVWPRLPSFRLQRRARHRRRLLLGPAIAVLPSVLVMALVVSSCGAPAIARPGKSAPPDYPVHITPAQVMEYTVKRQTAVEALYRRPGNQAAVTQGRVYTFRDSVTTQGSLQVSVFAPDIDSHDPAEQAQMQQQIGTGAFSTVLFGSVRLLEGFTDQLHFFLWFPPDHSVMELFIFRRPVSDAESVVRHVIAYQRGLSLPNGDLQSSAEAPPPGTAPAATGGSTT